MYQHWGLLLNNTKLINTNDIVGSILFLLRYLRIIAAIKIYGVWRADNRINNDHFRHRRPPQYVTRSCGIYRRIKSQLKCSPLSTRIYVLRFRYE